jgi:hypothetical protein
MDRDGELRLLGELCIELTRFGFGVQLYDSAPGLAVSTARPGRYVWVFVGESGRTFTWRRDDNKHPADDVPGAAVEIAKFVVELDGLNGAAPRDEA